MGDVKLSLLDSSKLPDIGVKLIDAVQKAVGKIYEPTHIKRIAKAQAAAEIISAEIISAENAGQVQEINLRTATRLAHLEHRRQENIEAICAKAVDQILRLPEPDLETPVDEDWLCNFFDQAQDVGNDDMQNIWTKILAGEVAQPGSFSHRTLNVVKLLSRKEAQDFTTLCSFIWNAADRKDLIVLKKNDLIMWTGEPAELLRPCLRLPPSYDLLLRQQSAGLVTLEELPLFNKRHQYSMTYFDRAYEVSTVDHSPVIRLGYAALTTAGKELVPIAGAVANGRYREMMVTFWKTRGFTVKELPPPAETLPATPENEKAPD